MKIRVTLSDPYGVDESTREAAREQVNAIQGLSKSEGDDLVDSRQSEICGLLKPWITLDESITIEFDTDFGTATVVKSKEG